MFLIVGSALNIVLAAAGNNPPQLQDLGILIMKLIRFGLGAAVPVAGSGRSHGAGPAHSKAACGAASG